MRPTPARWMALVALIALAAVFTAPQAQAQRRKKDRAKDAPAQDSRPAPLPSSIAVVARPSGPVLAVGAERHEFGRVQQGELVRHTFTITNDGSQDLVIADVKPSCGCTAPVWPREALKPGEKAEIQVTFNTAGKLGPQQKYISVRSNAGLEPRNLYLVGEVVSPVIPLVGATPPPAPKQN